MLNCTSFWRKNERSGFSLKNIIWKLVWTPGNYDITLKIEREEILGSVRSWLGWLGVDLSSSSLPLFIKSHFHFFQNWNKNRENTMVIYFLAELRFILTKKLENDRSGFSLRLLRISFEDLFGHPVIMILHLKLKEKRFLDQCEVG